MHRTPQPGDGVRVPDHARAAVVRGTQLAGRSGVPRGGGPARVRPAPGGARSVRAARGRPAGQKPWRARRGRARPRRRGPKRWGGGRGAYQCRQHQAQCPPAAARARAHRRRSSSATGRPRYRRPRAARTHTKKTVFSFLLGWFSRFVDPKRQSSKQRARERARMHGVERGATGMQPLHLSLAPDVDRRRPQAKVRGLRQHVCVSSSARGAHRARLHCAASCRVPSRGAQRGAHPRRPGPRAQPARPACAHGGGTRCPPLALSAAARATGDPRSCIRKTPVFAPPCAPRARVADSIWWHRTACRRSS